MIIEETKTKIKKVKKIKEEQKEKILSVDRQGENKKAKKDGFGITIEEMTEKGLCLGHQVSKLNPKMSGYITGIKNDIHIINLEKTAVCLEKALKFISELVKENKTILMVGTKPALKNLIQETAQECNFPYIVERWLGGYFTNFKNVFERVKSYRELQEQKEKGELERFIKKERICAEKKLVKMGKKFEGIKNLEKLPDAVFICDIKQNQLTLKEAKMKEVKVVAIVDTNVDPTAVDFPIPANDGSIPSVKYILDKIKQAVKYE